MKRYRILARQTREVPAPRKPFRLPRRKGRSWTPEQERAISLQGGGILVAAAAGSGKTAVLVERVIRRITEGPSPVPADRLLVVTFTNAAAAEMRSRIALRLREKIAAEPENAFLERQLLLLSKARICTMDAFFSAMVRENFERLGVSPALRIADEPELAAMRAGAMDAVLERRFSQPDPDFLAAAEYFGDESGVLGREVLNVYEKTRSLPDPKGWMEAQQALYGTALPPEETSWGKELLSRARHALQAGEETARRIRALLSWDEGLLKSYGPAIASDWEMFRTGLQLADAGDWDGLAGFLAAASFGPIGRASKNAPPAIKDQAQQMRALCKSAMEEARKCVPCSSLAFREDLERLAPVVRGIFSLVRDFGEEFSAAKAERSAADFSDYAYWTLDLVVQKDGSPTDLARELSGQFEEILLDEYQDTNRLQDCIFRAISRNGENLFLVGDLKQSIYRFRSADPTVFAEKQERFSEDGAFPALLRLSRNFRSRAGVLDAVNCVFSQIMSPEVGGVAYRGGEMVHPGASYPERPEPCVQVQLIDLKESGTEDSRVLAEARQTARRIAAMLRKGHPVTEKGVLRPCRGGDFAILLRSAQGADGIYCEALREEGVDASVTASEGYFTSREVAVMLSLLEVLDNPLQDIPMAALYLSPMGGGTCDGLAALRHRHPDTPLYNALNDEARAGDPQAAELLSLLSSLREKAAVKRVRALIQYIYDATDFVEVVSGLSASAEREANLKLLLNYAGSYEKQGSGELSGFVAYIRRLMEEKKDFEVANPLTEEANAVRILTAHRSKGLEYPIVILGNCSKSFNLRDMTGDVCYSAQAGYGLRVVRRDTAQRYETVPSAAVRLREHADAVSEEQRLLYVAMTRARETLILNITERNLGGKLSKLSGLLEGTAPLSPYAAEQAQSWSDWLLAALLRHPGFGEVRRRYGLTLEHRQETFPLDLGWTEAATGQEIAAQEPAPPADPRLVERLRETALWQYPHESRTKIPAKLAVTDLVRQQEETDGPRLPLPAFTQAIGFTPAQKGSIFHRALQFADYAAGRRDPDGELARLVDRGYLTAAEAEAVSRKHFAAFFRSPLMDRILQADRVLREYRFFSTVPAAQAGYEGSGDILIQGIADCVLEEKGAGVILDYKTDAAPPEELVRRYALQLSLYRRALEPLFPNGIKECLIYSAYSDQTVPVPDISK